MAIQKKREKRRGKILGDKDMKWITRERVWVDRVACPWLIKKLLKALDCTFPTIAVYFT